METLPVEMVEKITQHLTPEDLARCCGVSQGWRQVFDQDWLWEPLCDPELEEPLQATPCVVEPVFASPEVANSTLTPISYWRLVYLREKRLWNNWKLRRCKEEKLFELKSEIKCDFLTDTFVIRWCENHIELWETSIIPAAFVAKTDESVCLSGWKNCWVNGTNMLIIEKENSVHVFHVNLPSKCIKLKHDISFNEKLSYYSCQSAIKGNILVRVSGDGSKLIIFDSDMGQKIKEEPSPMMKNQNERTKIHVIFSSATTDDVVVAVSDPWSADNLKLCYYIYSPKKLSFFPGPVIDNVMEWDCGVAIHGHYLAIGDQGSFKIYNYQTSEVIYEISECKIDNVGVFSDCFIFVEYKDGQG